MAGFADVFIWVLLAGSWSNQNVVQSFTRAFDPSLMSPLSRPPSPFEVQQPDSEDAISFYVPLTYNNFGGTDSESLPPDVELIPNTFPLMTYHHLHHHHENHRPGSWRPTYYPTSERPVWTIPPDVELIPQDKPSYAPHRPSKPIPPARPWHPPAIPFYRSVSEMNERNEACNCSLLIPGVCFCSPETFKELLSLMILAVEEVYQNSIEGTENAESFNSSTLASPEQITIFSGTAPLQQSLPETNDTESVSFTRGNGNQSSEQPSSPKKWDVRFPRETNRDEQPYEFQSIATENFARNSNDDDANENLERSLEDSSEDESYTAGGSENRSTNPNANGLDVALSEVVSTAKVQDSDGILSKLFGRDVAASVTEQSKPGSNSGNSNAETLKRNSPTVDSFYKPKVNHNQNTETVMSYEGKYDDRSDMDGHSARLQF